MHNGKIFTVSAELGAQVGGVSGGGRGNVEVFAKWRDVGESSVNYGDRNASSVNDAGDDVTKATESGW